MPFLHVGNIEPRHKSLKVACLYADIGERCAVQVRELCLLLFLIFKWCPQHDRRAKKRKKSVLFDFEDITSPWGHTLSLRRYHHYIQATD